MAIQPFFPYRVTIAIKLQSDTFIMANSRESHRLTTAFVRTLSQKLFGKLCYYCPCGPLNVDGWIQDLSEMLGVSC